MRDAKQKEFVTFSPALRAGDACANYWMRQAVVRLRREVCWCWQERGAQPVEQPAALPPFAEKSVAALDMTRFWEQRLNFYRADPTARYLTELLDAEPPSAA